jgi:mannan endo-1,4-beta-mannosidase
MNSIPSFFTALALACLLTACGGGGAGGNDPGGSATVEAADTTRYTLGGTVVGLATGKILVLSNNGSDLLPLSTNGQFQFVQTLPRNAPYSVTVTTQPQGQTCSISNHAGTAASSNVTNVNVACTDITPPPLGSGIKTSGNQLQDAAGQKVVLRGVNVPVFKSGYADDLARVISAVKSSGANSVRIVWWSNPPAGTTEFTMANFENAIRTVANAGILPIIELHDATCFLAVPLADCNDTAIFKARITDFWTRADVMTILKKYQGYLVVNLANEWGRLASESADASAFISHYAAVLQTVRTAWSTAGLGDIPIMIDAPNGGSYSAVFLGTYSAGVSNGRYLVNSDPNQNVIFSTHAYWPSSEGHTTVSIEQRLQNIADSGLPFVVGEVGRNANGNCGNTDLVDWQVVMRKAAALELGSLGWAWYEEGCAAMNLTVNKDGYTLPTNDGTNDFMHRMLYDTNFGLSSAKLIPNHGLSAGYSAMTATIDWTQCAGGQALAEGTDRVSNSNCNRGAVSYSGLNEAKAYLDNFRITDIGGGDWRWTDDLAKKVTDAYLLRTAQCHSALSTLQNVGGGATGNELYAGALSRSINNAVSLTGGRNKNLTALFQYSVRNDAWSCN